MLRLLFLAVLCTANDYSDLTDITGKVFGNTNTMIPAAFGDFNADKLTDMVVLKSVAQDDVSTLQILLAKEPKVTRLI